MFGRQQTHHTTASAAHVSVDPLQPPKCKQHVVLQQLVQGAKSCVIMSAASTITDQNHVQESYLCIPAH